MELLYLTYFTAIVLIGMLCTLISAQIRIPKMLLLVLAGVALGNLKYNGHALIEFPFEFTASIFILSLAIIVFDSSSRFKLREFDIFSISAMKLSIVFIIVCMLLLSLFTSFIFGVPLILSMLFGALMAGTDSGIVMSMVKSNFSVEKLGSGKINSKSGGGRFSIDKTASNAVKLLEIESIVNTPLSILIPFLILDLIKNSGRVFDLNLLVEQVKPFLLQVIIGIGTGLLVGLIIFKSMRKYYSRTISPLALMGAALLSYILAENLGGSGVLAVTTAGLFFGGIYIKEKSSLQDFSGLFSSFLEIIVLVMIGILVRIPFHDADFIIRSCLLFFAYIILRFVTVYLVSKDKFTLKEMLFMSLNAPKGIATVVVAVLLLAHPVSTLGIYASGIKIIVNLALAFILYSIILSTLSLKLSKYLLKTELCE